MRHTSSLGTVAALAAFLCPAAFPASIHGLVKDTSGAAVTGAGVELREVPGPGSARNTRTDGAGAFQFTNLSGSHYRVRVTQTGFKIYESDVAIEEGKDASVDIALSIAEPRESIIVAGGRRQTVDAVYLALREAGIEDVYAVENVVLTRDAGVLMLKKGTIGFTAPQMGRDTMAVFIGEGQFDFVPGLSVEKAHLKNLTAEEQVHESFDRAFFCFTDSTGKELRGQAAKQAADPKMTEKGLLGFAAPNSRLAEQILTAANTE